MESAAAKAHAQMSQNDFSPPARLSSWGDSGRVWRMRHKFWLPSQMYSKRKEPLCAGGKAVVRPELFVRLRSKWGRLAYVPGSVLPFETRAAQHLPPPLDEIPQPQGSIQIPLSDVNAFAYLGNSALVNAPPPWPLRRGHCGKRRRR